MFLRSKGLNILSYVEFSIDFITELLTNQGQKFMLCEVTLGKKWYF